MSFNRSGYIGRAPGDSAITIAKQYFQPTGVQTDFTFSSGYSPGLVDVYRNGVKLINVLDYAATDGSTISLDSPVGVGSTVQVVAYKAFNLATVKATELDTSVTGTDLTLGGDLTVSALTTTVDINVSGSATVSGTVVAGSFSGDGSGLTGVANTDYVVSVATTTGNLNVSAAATITGDLTVSDSIAITKDINVGAAATITGAIDANATTDSTSSTTGAITAAGGVGIAKDLFVGDAIDVTKDLKVGAAVTITGALSGSTGTFSGAVSGSTGTFSGAVNVDATTDSTSSTTGALIVDGGLGVAKNVYIGAGLSVAGTLTYEDVTSVDSVGLITAKSGVNITGGQLTVGSGITMGIAGVATFSGTADVHLRDNVKLLIGDGSSNDGDLRLWHDGTHSWIYNYNGQLTLGAKQGEDAVKIYPDEQVELYWNAAKKLETTNDGVSITGICTATDFSGASGGAADFPNGITASGNIVINTDAYLKIGIGNDLQLAHNGSNSYVDNSTGHLYIRSGTGIDLTNAAGSENYVVCTENGSVKIYYDHSKKFETTNEGIEVTGFTSTTAGMGVTGGLFEGSFIKAGKLSDNLQIGIATANVFYFTTAETTTATPNIRWNDTYSLSNKMAVGDMASVTVITTAAAAGYAANWTIDGNAVTEEWVGGSAPSEGGADGLDIYSLTIIKTGTGTGDSGFKVIANVSNAT